MKTNPPPSNEAPKGVAPVSQSRFAPSGEVRIVLAPMVEPTFVCDYR